MNIKEGTHVFNAEGDDVGSINRIVLNPVSKKVTHIVVQKGLLFKEDKVVPVEWITSTEDDRVNLSASANDMDELPPFEETYYVSLDESERQRHDIPPAGYTPSYYWYPPYGVSGYLYTPMPAPMMIEKTDRNIPQDAVALKEGADVISAEGDHIGDVERVFTDPESDRATHFLISQGLLLKERKLVPIDWISSIAEDKVRLAVGKGLVERLPEADGEADLDTLSYQPHRETK